MKNRLEEIEGIPSGLVTCFYNDIGIEVLALSPQSITVRVPDTMCADCLKVAFYSFAKHCYKIVTIKVTLIEMRRDTFYAIYDYSVEEDENYTKQVRALSRDYYTYITNKINYEDAVVSEEMVQYPAEKDAIYATDFVSQMRSMMKDDDWQGVFRDAVDEKQNVEFAFCLDTPTTYLRFLHEGIDAVLPAFMRDDLEIRKHCRRVYIGNQFCHNLFPQDQMLWSLLERAREEQLQITLVFTYLRDEMIEEMKDLLDRLAHWCKEEQECVEILCNDFGMLTLLQGRSELMQISVGSLLNKRRKDPRYQYKKGFQDMVDRMQENAWNSETMQAFSREYHIKRLEYETCGYEVAFPTEGFKTLQVPFYQTNTAQFCPLYAVCKTGERGKQKLVKNCSYDCEKYVLGYPLHLKQVGRGNSIFAYDDALCHNVSWLRRYIQEGVDRIVWNALSFGEEK